ncbi:hypothetical protein [Roseomonas sp. AR75]|uniref:hypothetical protein n=1 Tax=Roseomonas sp. AR75 TaxID=2562311 RepID=UPI0014855CF0|nr:hypothetical protein [Roseomonas sp. AR75]
MRNLLQDADRDRLLAPLAGALVGEVLLAGRPHRAVAETLGSSLYPAQANAAAVELLFQPGIRPAHAALGDALLDFVMAMADAPVPSRRAAAGGLALQRDDPGAVEAETPFSRFSGDLMRGEVRQALRGGAAIRHTGNLVEFRIGHRRFCVDAEETIVSAGAVQEVDRIVLHHVSTIRGEAGLLRPRPVEAGTLEMRYELRGDSPVVRVKARFTAARRLGRVRITTAVDGLDDSGLEIGAARLLEGGAWREATPPAAPGATKWTQATPVAHLALGRPGFPEAAPVLHLRPRDPAKVMSVTAQAQRGGVLHWLLLRHGPVSLAAGETLAVEEERFLGAGAVATIAAAMERGGTGFDLDAAPPSGAAMQAAAAALLLDDRATPARREALRGFLGRQAERIEAAEPVPGDLAGAAIAADMLRRAGEAEAAALQARLLARLATLCDAETGVVRPASLGGQALAILAFARAAVRPDAPDEARLVARLLGAVAAEPGSGLLLAGAPVDAAADPEGVALLARAAGCAALAAEAGGSLPEEVANRARDLHRAAVALLRPLVRPRLGILEVVGPAGVTASLQTLATLALLAPDRLMLDSRPADAAPA